MVPATAQFIYQAHDLDKPEMIGRLLQAEGADLMIVFTRTKRQAQRIADDLEERGFNSAPLHGDMAQAAREKALTKFRDGKLQVLVATDVAARGIDVTGVTHVVNYTCPEDEKTYGHRIGRTGRAGATGIAITFVDWADLHRWKMINKALDLPFDDPQETYSSSEHFLHDQGITPGTKGRVIPEGQVVIERKPRTDGRGGGRSQGGRGGRQDGRSSQGGRSQGGAKDAGSESRQQGSGAEGSGDRPAKKRNRNRRRTRGGKPAAAGDNG
jgi:superfamily II DNA/RNA helicase